MEELESWSGLDAIDIQIIQHLSDDGRKPFTEIADALGVNERTVRMRVEKLRVAGVLHIVGVVNPIQVGLKIQAIVQIAVAPGALDAVIETIQAIDQVRFMVVTSGEYQLLTQVRVRSHEELTDFLMKKLNPIEGIAKTNVIIEMKVLKNTYKIFVGDNGS